METNVAIVGAGPAGIGVARVLSDLGVPGVRILERERVGATFRRWTTGMQFISPSFPGNNFGLTDLNAISYDSSPAFSLRREHPSGQEYAHYLQQAATAFALQVEKGVDVRWLEAAENAIILHTSKGIFQARFVIWAAGQYQYPDTSSVAGADLGVHSSSVTRWADHPGEDVLVIGGYESGIDAAIGLTAAGKKVTVLSRDAPWDVTGPDPSLTLSPFTRQRLDAILRRRSITLEAGADVVALEQDEGCVRALAANGRSWTTSVPPILATGYRGSTRLIDEWLERDDKGYAVLSSQDESTKLPGLFLVGPEVHHRGHLFCYIYKFRQRFAVVGNAIAERLDLDTSILQAYRRNNMYLDDLSCCDEENCVC